MHAHESLVAVWPERDTLRGMEQLVVSTFYKFVAVDDPEALQASILAVAEANAVMGTTLVAAEGINGTVAASRLGTDEFFGALRADERFVDLETKESFVDFEPFKRLKVRLKKEIVTLRQSVDPTRLVGTYIEAQDWNSVVDDPGVLLLETRNREEVEVGTFAGAIDPEIDTFTEFADFVATLDPAEHPRVAMFCTGGIRCEKASSYMLEQGFEQVMHLKGGILKYFEQVDAADSRWVGECFVFDDRVTVDHQLEPGGFTLCRGCRSPLSDVDRQHGAYEEGVSCAHCVETLTEQRRTSLGNRHRQETLARQRGVRHIGRIE